MNPNKHTHAFDPMRLPLEHTHAPLTISRMTAVLVAAILYGAGVATALWLVIAIKGGAL